MGSSQYLPSFALLLPMLSELDNMGVLLPLALLQLISPRSSVSLNVWKELLSLLEERGREQLNNFKVFLC